MSIEHLYLANIGTQYSANNHIIFSSVKLASVQLDSDKNLQGKNTKNNEISNFILDRYIESTEATWRIYELTMHFQSHVIIRIGIHLPQRHNVYFAERARTSCN